MYKMHLGIGDSSASLSTSVHGDVGEVNRRQTWTASVVISGQDRLSSGRQAAIQGLSRELMCSDSDFVEMAPAWRVKARLGGQDGRGWEHMIKGRVQLVGYFHA